MLPRVLIVDDDRDMCELLVQRLSARGFEPAFRTSGSEAFEALEREPFDVVVGLRLEGHKLLRVLQERSVRPVGGNREIPYDARLIGATNRDVEAAVAEGRLRQDLFFRLDVLHIELPPLRARGGDVLLLAQHFLERCAVRVGKPVRGLSGAAAEKLLAYSWPGNVRELENCIERAVALTSHEQLVIEAPDGREALSHVGSLLSERRGASRQGIIVADVQMPGLSGIDLLRAVRVLHLDTPVILATAYADAATAGAAASLGAAQLLAKPFRSRDLLRAVERASRRLRRSRTEAVRCPRGRSR